MEKLEARTENILEAQALENAIKILARMTVRAIMNEISTQRKTLYKVDVEPAVLSPKIHPEQQEKSLVLTAREGAQLLRVSRSTIYELMRTRQIPSIRFGKRILIPRAALTKILNETSN